MRNLVAIFCAVSVAASLTVQDPSAPNGDSVTSLLLKISERLDEMDQRLSRSEDRLTLRLDTIDSYFDEDAPKKGTQSCDIDGSSRLGNIEAKLSEIWDAINIDNNEPQSSDNVSSRLGKTEADLSEMRDKLNLTALQNHHMDDRMDTLEAKLDSLQGMFCALFNRGQALISGNDQRVPDSAISASSSWMGRTDHGPQCSRLGVPKPAGCGAFSWTGDERENQWWIQVDLMANYTIEGVATQARGDILRQYVSSYNLAAFDNQRVLYYLDLLTATPQVFAGNSGNTAIVRHQLSPALKARVVRLYVISYNDYPSLRWEIYGFKAVC